MVSTTWVHDGAPYARPHRRGPNGSAVEAGGDYLGLGRVKCGERTTAVTPCGAHHGRLVCSSTNAIGVTHNAACEARVKDPPN